MAVNDDLITVIQHEPMLRDEVTAYHVRNVAQQGYSVDPTWVRVPAYGERLLGFSADGDPIVERFADGYSVQRYKVFA